MTNQFGTFTGSVVLAGYDTWQTLDPFVGYAPDATVRLIGDQGAVGTAVDIAFDGVYIAATT